MVKYLILFLLIAGGSYAQSALGSTYSELREYYYNILLKDLLKDADRQELVPAPIISPKWKAEAIEWHTYMKNGGPDSIIIKTLKEHYNMNLKVRDLYMARGSAGDQYKYWLFLVRGLPNKEQAWFLFSVKSRRYAWLKEKIEEPAWKKVNLQEIRDNNTYTFLLRKWNINNTYQCTFSQKFNWLDGNENVDSIGILAIAIAAAANRYSSKMTPIAAKFMGNNKEHWLIYCFPTIQDNANLQEICYKTIVNRYKEGFNLWNWSFFYISDDSIGHHSEIVSLLISRKAGKILFMEKTGNGCSYRHNSEGKHIGVPSPPQTGPDYLR
jgi:hypothetical protein